MWGNLGKNVQHAGGREGGQRLRHARTRPAAEQAWRLLLESAYASPGQLGSILCARPKLDLAFAPPYDSVKLALAWQKLLDAAPEVGGTETHRYDVVNVSRQVLTNLAGEVFAEATGAYRAGDAQLLSESAARFLDLMRDIDDLLADRRDNKQPSTRHGIACRFTPRPVRYLRVTVTHNSANTGRHLVEVMAMAD